MAVGILGFVACVMGMRPDLRETSIRRHDSKSVSATISGMGFLARSDAGLICIVNGRMMLVDSDWSMLGCSERAVFSLSRILNAPIQFFFVETCGSIMQSGDSVLVFVQQKYRHARFASWENSSSVDVCDGDYRDRRSLRSRRKRHCQSNAFGDRLQQTK